jgi:hypothetical protein
MKKIAFTFFCIICFSVSSLAQVTELWNKQNKSLGVQFLMDSTGNSYLFTYSKNGSVLLKKVNPDGAIIWSINGSNIPNSNTYTAKAIFDKSGNILASVYTNPGDSNFLIKYDTNGNILWKKLYTQGSLYIPNIHDFAVDSKNNIYLVYIHPSDSVYYFMKADSIGNMLHIEPIYLPNHFPEWTAQLKVASLDHAYICFNGGTNPPLISYLAGIDSTGVLSFFTPMPGSIANHTIQYYLEVDKGGNCIAVATQNDSLYMNLLKYDKNGNILWSNTNGMNFISATNIDANDNLYLGGKNVFDSLVIKKLTNSGTVIWEYAYKNNSSLNNWPVSLRLARDGSVFILCLASDTTTTNTHLTLLQLHNNGTLMNKSVKEFQNLTQTLFTGMNIDTLNNAYIFSTWYYPISGQPQNHLLQSNMYKLCVGRCLPNISGSLYLDTDSNCLFTTNETGLHNQLVKIEPNDIYASTDSLGMYKFLLDTGIYTIKPLFQHKYMIHSCAKDSQLLAINATTPLALADFGAYYNPNIFDLQVSYAAALPRPGFIQHHTISYANVGTMPVNNALVQFELDLSVFSYVSMNPPADSISGNKVFWKLAPLNVFQTGSIHFTTKVDSTIPINTLFVNIASIFPYLPDTVKYDNFDTLRERVFGAYDPNQKLVSTTQHSAINPLSPAENELAYQIDFQNTGNDTAFTVVLIDSLSDLLDVSTLRIGAGSHNFSWDISGKALLKFTFNNILLPDSHSNESKSHGFVKFYIRPKSNLPASAIIANTATINFDFNSGVRTNTAYYPSSPIGIYETKFWSNTSTIKLFPNPTTGEFNLSYYLTTNTNVKLYLSNLLGEKINLYSNNSEKAGEHLLKFNLNNLNLKAGLYFVHLQENGNSRVGKLVLGR